jgi:hypothetical protein
MVAEPGMTGGRDEQAGRGAGRSRGLVRAAALVLVLGSTGWAALTVWPLANAAVSPPDLRHGAVVDACTAFAIDRATGHAVAAPCTRAGLAILAAASAPAVAR